tara:strand:- start:803 stop:1681 length:879 start_codon:yes stop_codon:yes gene_type:complete
LAGLSEDSISTSPVATEFQFGSGDLLLPEFAPESEADSDLGVQMVLQPEAEYDPFTVSAFTGYYFSSNANLSESTPIEDHVFTAGATISYLPVLQNNLYGEATFRDQVFLYNNQSNLDFNAFDLGAGLIYVIRPLGDTSVYTRYNYAQFSDPTIVNLGTSNYKNHSIQAGVYKGWILARNHFAYATWRSDVSIDGNPASAKRDDHSAIVGYRWTPVDRLKVECFLRGAFLDYSAYGREDWNTAAGSSLSYNFTPNIYLSAFISYTKNDSNLNIDSDYKLWQPGIKLGGNWKF